MNAIDTLENINRARKRSGIDIVENLARARKLMVYIQSMRENGISITFGFDGDCTIKDVWNDYVEGSGANLAAAIDDLPRPRTEPRE